MGIMKNPGGLRADAGRRGRQPSLATIMRALTNPQSGKHGTSVSLDGGYGQVERQLVIPKNPATAAQVRPRRALSRFAAYWRKLTEAQRQAWMASGKGVSTRPKFGQSGPLTGCAFFIQINCNLASIDLPMVVDPPERPQFGLNPVRELSATNTGGDIALKLKVSGALAQYTIVLGAAPCSAGVYYVDHFVILGLLPTPIAGYSDITDMYVRRYGKPPVGTKVFICTRQQIDGWEDQSIQTSAIVPAA